MRPPNPLVVLFDIDGTLIRAGGAGKRALEETLRARFGSRDAFDKVSFAGNTDPSIVREGLTALGVPPRAELIEELLDDYLVHLQRELSETAFEVLEGAAELVQTLRACRDVAVGLGTGNTEAGSRLKLERAGLAGHFEFGGFGCDSEDRATLVRVGADRGLERLGPLETKPRVIIIGDTPRDIAAAKAIDAECIAVTTGGFPHQDLTTHGAELVVDTLADPGIPTYLEIPSA